MYRAFIFTCLMAALIPIFVRPGDLRPGGAEGPEPEWPATFEGSPLVRLALSAREQRVLADFPGHVARFTDGEREIIIYYISTPSRYVHFVSHCMAYHGWERDRLPDLDDGWSNWRLQRVESSQIRNRRSVINLRERIIDEAGQAWPTAEPWHLAARLKQTSGPWWAYCVAETPPNLQASNEQGAPILKVAE